LEICSKTLKSSWVNSVILWISLSRWICCQRWFS